MQCGLQRAVAKAAQTALLRWAAVGWMAAARLPGEGADEGGGQAHVAADCADEDASARRIHGCVHYNTMRPSESKSRGTSSRTINSHTLGGSQPLPLGIFTHIVWHMYVPKTA